MKLTRQPIRLATRVIAFFLISVLCTGCIQVEFSSVFKREGVAEHTLSVAIPRDLFEAAEEQGQADAFTDISSRAADAGLIASRIITVDTVTLRVSTERPDGEDSGAALNSLLNATGINQQPGISAPFSGGFRQEGAAVGGSNFVLDMSVDGELLYDAAASTDIAVTEDRATLEENVTIRYRAYLPGDLGESTGEILDEGAIQWIIGPNETVPAVAESSAGDTSRAALFIVAAIASAVGVLSLAAMIGWVLVRRPALATSIAAAAVHFPRRTTITREGLWVSDRIRRIVDRIWYRGAPYRAAPLDFDPLDDEQEGGDDGAHSEGDRPSDGVRGG